MINVICVPWERYFGVGVGPTILEAMFHAAVDYTDKSDSDQAIVR